MARFRFKSSPVCGRKVLVIDEIRATPRLTRNFERFISDGADIHAVYFIENRSIQEQMSTTSPHFDPILPSPLVSVIVPTYNRAHMLKEAIDSVLAQSYTRFELIVVDDGSTDATNALLKSYGHSIKTIYQENRGVSAARNSGIRAASGELIALLDSDDYWLPEKLTAQVDLFVTQPQAIICQTEEIWIRNGVRVNPKQRHKKQSGMIFEASLHLCLISPSAVMMRKSLLDKVGTFDEKMPACEDYDLWLRITCRYPAHLIPKQLIVKRGGHDDQLSRLPELDKYRIASIVKMLLNEKLSTDQYAAACDMLGWKCRIYAQGCRKRGRSAEAHEYDSLRRRFSRQ